MMNNVALKLEELEKVAGGRTLNYLKGEAYETACHGICPECGTRFARIGSYLVDTYRMHIEAECDVCSKRFFITSNHKRGEKFRWKQD